MNYTQVIFCALFTVFIYFDVTPLRVAVVGVKGGSDQSIHAHTGLQLQPLPTPYKALENMRRLLPPSPSLFQLPVLWTGRK